MDRPATTRRPRNPEKAHPPPQNPLPLRQTWRGTS
jgi:hypothetical protein